MSSQRSHWITSDKLNLYAKTDGDPKAIPLVLVHGYPDNHRVWDKVTKTLSRDYFVIRYDVRGSGQSDKPKRSKDYRLELLANDLQAVVDQLIPGRDFHLVAHDWGAIQSWESVTGTPLQPRIRSYTSISGPCLDHVGFSLRHHLSSPGLTGKRKVLSQVASSWYVFLFQLPLIPELMWRSGLDRLWPDYLKRYEQVADAEFSRFQKSDGLYGVNLYRANVLPRLIRPRHRRAHCPVQVIVPRQDAYVKPHMNEHLVRWTGKLTRQELDAPHWAPLTDADAVSRSVQAFVSAHH